MRQAGMTLIELVLTISIIMLLALVFVPKLMNAAPRLAVESEGIRARADLQYAQQLAIAHNAPCQVVFDKPSGGILIKERVGGTFTTVSERCLEHGVRIGFTTFAAATVTFDELGTPDRTGTLCLAGTDGSVVTVVVAPGTGSVRVLSNGKEL
jgi:Tfp pilus assembly protein FimT